MRARCWLAWALAGVAALSRAAPGLAQEEPATLRLTTVPVGALVTLDGEPLGHTPLERELPAGAHRLRVELSGFVTIEEALALEPGKVRELSLQLGREAVSAPAPGVRAEASPWNWILGGALVLGAVPALVSSLTTLADDGECAGRTDELGRCEETVRFGARSAILLGVGVGALGAGAYFLVAQPLRLEAGAGPGRARLSLRIDF